MAQTPAPPVTPKNWSGMLDWAYGGVDHSLPGNGGQECVDFLPLWQRIAESIFVCIFSGFMMNYALKRVTLPEKIPPIDRSDRCGKRVLLVVMCLTFGVELGFKFATRQVIWLLNPCHITSIIQIYLLAAPPSRIVTAMFRMHLHMLTGAPIAIIFPVINTRLLPFETEVYFIQHILMMIIPVYLLKIGGVYSAEKLSDMSWNFLSISWLYFFHFVPLSYLAVLSQVNLNNMLCPAVSDPFYGRFYRICAMVHQMLALPLVGKVYGLIAKYCCKKQNNEVMEDFILQSNDKHSSVRTSEPDRVSNSMDIREGDDNTTAITAQQSSSDFLNMGFSKVSDSGSCERLKSRNGFVTEVDIQSGDRMAGRAMENGHVKMS